MSFDGSKVVQDTGVVNIADFVGEHLTYATQADVLPPFRTHGWGNDGECKMTE